MAFLLLLASGFVWLSIWGVDSFGNWALFFAIPSAFVACVLIIAAGRRGFLTDGLHERS